MKKKLLMFVYSDIKTDARVMRAVKNLRNQYNLTLIATSSNTVACDLEGYEFIDAVNPKINNPLMRYIDYLIKVNSYIRNNSPDILYGHDYYAAPIIALYSNKIRCVYDAHELYIADKNSSIREKSCFHFEKKAIENSDLVICASNRRRKIMEKIYKTKKKIVVIDNISLLPQNKLSENTNNRISVLDDFFKDGRKTVVYCGAIIKARKVENLLYSAQKLRHDIKVLIIGSGEEKNKLMSIKEQKSIDNCIFFDSIPYADIWAIITRCDIGYLYYENDTLNNKNCAPNKVYEYASAGLPMIANNNPGLTDVFDTYRVGATNEDMSIAIQEVLENYDIYKSNLDTFLNDCSWEKECERMKKAIADICR